MPASIKSCRIDESGTSAGSVKSSASRTAIVRATQPMVRSFAIIRVRSAPRLLDDAKIRRQLALAGFGAVALGLGHGGGLGGDRNGSPRIRWAFARSRRRWLAGRGLAVGRAG